MILDKYKRVLLAQTVVLTSFCTGQCTVCFHCAFTVKMHEITWIFSSVMMNEGS
jgi:hypothetical protein